MPRNIPRMHQTIYPKCINMHQTIYPESICPKSNNNSDKSITKINNNNNGSNKQYAYHINPIIAEMNPNPFQTKKNINSKKKLGVGASFAVDSRRRHDSRHWSLHRGRRRRRTGSGGRGRGRRRRLRQGKEQGLGLR